MNRPVGLLFVLLSTMAIASNAAEKSFRLAIVGLDHGHVDGVLADTLKRTDVQLVGVVESKPELAQQFAERFALPASLRFPSLEEMLNSARPEG
jgi:predicted dehydrogenase